MGSSFKNSNSFKNKCSFCQYATQSGCTVTPNSYYCRKATDEYYQYLQHSKPNQSTQKSLRSWAKNKLN